MMKRWVALALLLASGLVIAGGTTYKWVDENGKVNYSDQPPPANAKKIEEKKAGGNVVETSDLPYALREVVKKHPVILYATDCGEACDQARELLKLRGVPYTEKDPQLAQISEELQKLAGARTVPALRVGQSKVVQGFEQTQWHRELDAAGYPKTSVLPKKAGAPIAPKQTSDPATSR
jgi:glutaredoxin